MPGYLKDHTIRVVWHSKNPKELMIHTDHSAFLLWLYEMAGKVKIQLPIFYLTDPETKRQMTAIIAPVSLCPWQLSDIPGRIIKRRSWKNEEQRKRKQDWCRQMAHEYHGRLKEADTSQK